MSASEEQMAGVDNYTAEVTLAITDEVSYEGWIFLWNGVYTRVLVNRPLPLVWVLTQHTPENTEKITAFVRRMLKRGNDSDDED